MESKDIGAIIKRMTPQFKLEETAHVRIKLASFGVPKEKLAKMTLRELLELERSGEYEDKFTGDASKLKDHVMLKYKL